MTFAEAVGIMIGGSENNIPILPRPNDIQYYDYQSSVQDYGYDGTSYTYDDYRTVPKDSIVIQYYIRYDNGGYKYVYHIYQLIIEDIDAPSEELVGIIDLQTNKEYRFQLNVRGGK